MGLEGVVVEVEWVLVAELVSKSWGSELRVAEKAGSWRCVLVKPLKRSKMPMWAVKSSTAGLEARKVVVLGERALCCFFCGEERG